LLIIVVGSAAANECTQPAGNVVYTARDG
jgi:hypothetical protein